MIKIFAQEKHKHFIPIIALIVGVTVCILCFILAKDILPENISFLDNLLRGILCGLSSTGLHQLLTHLNLHKQNKKQQKGKQNKEQVIDLKPITFKENNILNKELNNENLNNLNNYYGAKCANCPYNNKQDEPEIVEQKNT